MPMQDVRVHQYPMCFSSHGKANYKQRRKKKKEACRGYSFGRVFVNINKKSKNHDAHISIH